MTTRKPLSFKQAYKFAATKTIDHARSFVMYTLSWFGIILAFALAFAGIGAAICLPYLHNLVPATDFATFAKTCLVGYRAGLAGLFVLAILAASSFLMAFAEFQLLRFAHTYYQNKTITLSELFTIKGTPFFKFWAARALYWLKIILGFILLVIPGIYFAYTYMFSGYSILEGKTTSIGEDARISAKLTSTVKWRLFLAIMLPPLLFAGTRGLIIIFMGPISVLIMYHLYEQLKASATQKEPNA